MIPLEEVSANTRRSINTPRDKLDDHGSTSNAAVPSSAVQSMLKTTTELGDLGQFGTGLPRRPRSGSHIQTTRARSGSFDTSFASALRHQRSPYARPPGRHHGPRPIPSMSTLSARHASRSNLSSYTHSTRSRRRPSHRHLYPLQDLTSPSPSLYTHRSLVTLRSNRDVYSIRSDSPGGCQRSMRRPPYGTSSPAFMDDHSLHTPHPPFMRAPSTGTVASSPTSAYTRRDPHPGSRPHLNGSYTFLHRFPSPAYLPTQGGPFPGRILPGIPHAPVSSLRATGAFSGGAPSLAGIPQSPSRSTTPSYYDYSESFVEENGFSPDHVEIAQGPPLTMNQTILEGVPTPYQRHAQTPFGTREGSKFHPVELPTKHNRRPSEHSRNSSKPNSRHSAKRSFSGAVPQRVSNFDAPVAYSSPSKLADMRRTRSEDSGPSEILRPDLRRASTISRRTIPSSPSGGFFSSANRSPRDLALLAARVHSPPPDSVRKSRFDASKDKSRAVAKAQPHVRDKPAASGGPREPRARQTPEWQLPAFSFRPMSLTPYSSACTTRPKTSEATPGRMDPEIHSPMPKRPMSSQSQKRFSKILDIETGADEIRRPHLVKKHSWCKEPSLNAVEESPVRHDMESKAHFVTPSSASSALHSTPRRVRDAINENDARISQVTSHDKSTVESLLDRHIECLGLQPELDSTLDSIGSHNIPVDDEQTSADASTVRLTDILATAPHVCGRPMTSTSQQYSSLATLDRKAMRPRRLFASMDARVPGTIEEQWLPMTGPASFTALSRPSYGWQTLPSTSLLHCSSLGLPSLASGELADVDTSETRSKLRVKRRSLMSVSPSEASNLSTLSLGKSRTPRSHGLRKRPKSELVGRQASHRRRRIRIRLKLRTRSKTTGDLVSKAGVDPIGKQPLVVHDRPPLPPRWSSLKSPINGYAELSGDSVPVSQTNLHVRHSRSPPIPTRWSSIIAAMPQPVRKSAEIVRKTSVRTQRSQRSNTSVVEPINSTRLHGHIPRVTSIPQLAPPEFGPPLTSSDLNLSIPYAAVPSTVRPTLRETKRFFSDDSSARRQRKSLREKLHLHSLRNAVPVSAGTSLIAHSSRSNNGVKLSHSCQMKGRDSAELQGTAREDTVPMTDLAYQKQRMLERLKDWWKRQCLQKVVSGRRKSDRSTPGVVLR